MIAESTMTGNKTLIRNLNERQLGRRVEDLRQEVFELYVVVRAVQRALGSDDFALTAGLRDAGMRNNRIAEEVRRLRVALAMERDEGQAIRILV
jgi:hypothetical protein